MIIVQNRNIFFAITGLFIATALVSIAIFGLKLGIDFTGGSLAQITYDGGRPAAGGALQTL